VTPEQWIAVREVFDEALEIETADRNAWLENRCRTDRAVLEEVQRLLIADVRTMVSWQPLDASDDLTGRDIGPYKLLDKIGKGGMGCVYRAVRADAAFDKTVAVKLIRFRKRQPGSGERLPQRGPDSCRIDPPQHRNTLCRYDT
jgi:serine/threonine protein kinase